MLELKEIMVIKARRQNVILEKVRDCKSREWQRWEGGGGGGERRGGGGGGREREREREGERERGRGRGRVTYWTLTWTCAGESVTFLRALIIGAVSYLSLNSCLTASCTTLADICVVCAHTCWTWISIDGPFSLHHGTSSTVSLSVALASGSELVAIAVSDVEHCWS